MNGGICSIGTGLSVESTCYGVVTWDVRVKPCVRCLGGRSAGPGRRGRGAGREVVLGGGTTDLARVGAGGGVGVTLYDRLRRDTWIRERVFSMAGKVGRVTTVD